MLGRATVLWCTVVCCHVQDDSDEEGDGYDDEGGEDGSSDDGEVGHRGQQHTISSQKLPAAALSPQALSF